MKKELPEASVVAAAQQPIPWTGDAGNPDESPPAPCPQAALPPSSSQAGAPTHADAFASQLLALADADESLDVREESSDDAPLVLAGAEKT